jgi:hypothetical protein
MTILMTILERLAGLAELAALVALFVLPIVLIVRGSGGPSQASRAMGDEFDGTDNPTW